MNNGRGAIRGLLHGRMRLLRRADRHVVLRAVEGNPKGEEALKAAK